MAQALLSFHSGHSGNYVILSIQGITLRYYVPFRANPSLRYMCPEARAEMNENFRIETPLHRWNARIGLNALKNYCYLNER